MTSTKRGRGGLSKVDVNICYDLRKRFLIETKKEKVGERGGCKNPPKSVRSYLNSPL